MSTTNGSTAVVFPKTRDEWREALDKLPATPGKIPAFFFAHGSPILISDESRGKQMGAMWEFNGPKGPLAAFLKDFGPMLLKKYQPKGIVVFSAHWDTMGERLVSDYGDENPLFMDYYGFPPSLYQLQFKSRGDSALSQRVVEALKKAGIQARTTLKTEPRGMDGLGKKSPGFDHGVFVPFRLMFGDEFMDVPIVEVSMDGTLDPEKNWALGEAVQDLRREGVLVLSGGLLVHNLRDWETFVEHTAPDVVTSFYQAILSAVAIKDPAQRKKAMLDLVNHPGFRQAHPHEDHFIPLYVAAGAGGKDADVRILAAHYGQPTFAFDP
ncbi:Extradiol aromatic ring-opening dioxygenase [Epithele typhae]|uniref:Extradiol aromatic ring-opening dioxygenase n=1 Tax=Epithele typhae TaxID=378194 RepID=UPI002008C179|nr:Extradiol aromatic ring-opening dioxygenase [Epithele typhae]KAH9946241.1 Extradiol aromatic ring-opening dioxygenase [Epithele typhae]